MISKDNSLFRRDFVLPGLCFDLLLCWVRPIPYLTCHSLPHSLIYIHYSIPYITLEGKCHSVEPYTHFRRLRVLCSFCFISNFYPVTSPVACNRHPSDISSRVVSANATTPPIIYTERHGAKHCVTNIRHPVVLCASFPAIIRYVPGWSNHTINGRDTNLLLDDDC